MASSQQIQQIQQLQAQLEQTLNQLGKSNSITSRSVQDIVNGFGDARDAIDALNNLLAQANDELNQSADTVDTLNSKFKALLTNVTLLASKNGEITTENGKQLKAARDRVGLAQQLEKDAKGLIRMSKDDLMLTTKVLEKLKSRDGLDKKALDYAKQRLAEERKIEQSIELANKAYTAISKIPIFGSAFDVEGAKKAMQLEIESAQAAGKKVNMVKAFAIGLKEGIRSMFSLNGAIAVTTSLFKFLKDSIFAIDTGIGNLAKSMNVSYEAADMMYGRLDKIATSSNDWSRSSKNLEKTWSELNTQLGLSLTLSEKDLQFQNDLAIKAKLTTEERAAIFKLAKATNVEQKQFTDQALKQADLAGKRFNVAVSERKVLQDILNTSKATTLSLGGSAKALADANVAATKIGVRMSKLEDIASSLLDFESSISAELEAELLTGRQLNLEQARLYAINNNMVGLAKEIEKNYGSIAEFSQMNRLQQEAAAKAVGMTREELAGALLEAKAIGNATGEEAKNRREALNIYAETHGMAQAQRLLEKEGIEALMEQNTQQEKLNEAMDKMKLAMAKVFSGPFLKMIEGISSMLADTKTMRLIMSAIATYYTIVAVSAITAAMAKSLGFGIVTTLAAIGTGVATYYSLRPDAEGAPEGEVPPTPAGDLYLPPGAGKHTVRSGITGEIFSLAPEDAVIAAPVRGSQSGGNMAGVVAEIQRLGTAVMALANKPTVVSYDSNQADRTANTNRYEMATAYSNNAV